MTNSTDKPGHDDSLDGTMRIDEGDLAEKTTLSADQTQRLDDTVKPDSEATVVTAATTSVAAAPEPVKRRRVSPLIVNPDTIRR